MGKQLFGTDGIRGVAGEYPLDPVTVFCFGQALGAWAAGHGANPEVLIGMDTRESGRWIAETVAAGMANQGVRTRFAGLITTPGVAYLTKRDDFVAGLMISASHNPYADNGLKVFDHSGFKIPDEEEHRMEEEILRRAEARPEPKRQALEVDEGLDLEYLSFLEGIFEGSLGGRRIVVDCAHGASAMLGPELFRRLGAEVIAIGCEPNGRNINDGVGALHTDHLAARVRAEKADVGVAFDGDADRAMFITGSGKLIDGDLVLLIVGRHLKATGRLKHSLVVATVMSNLGLEVALREAGIEMVRTPVGDKYVLEEMIRREAPLGGEQSGHVIFREWATTGDGLLTALRVFEVMQATGKSLDELTADYAVFPQVLKNVRVKVKRPLSELPEVQARIAEAEKEFAGAGRVVVRFSGTEPLARVMVEGRTQEQVDRWAGSIAEAIRVELEQ